MKKLAVKDVLNKMKKEGAYIVYSDYFTLNAGYRVYNNNGELLGFIDYRQFEKLKNDITVKARPFSSVEYIAAEIEEEPEDLYFSTPETVRRDIIDINDVVNHKENKSGIRYVISREFTQEERDALKALVRQYPDKIYIPASPAYYRYAPEIKHDYFIILG